MPFTSRTSRQPMKDICVQVEARFQALYMDSAMRRERKEQALQEKLRLEAESLGRADDDKRLPEHLLEGRFDALYKDSEVRRQRKEHAIQESLRMEVESLGCKTSRCWAPSAAQNNEGWPEQQLLAFRRLQQERASARLKEAQEREAEALRECSFAPRLIARSAGKLRTAKARTAICVLAERQQRCLDRLQELREESQRLEETEQTPTWIHQGRTSDWESASSASSEASSPVAQRPKRWRLQAYADAHPAFQDGKHEDSTSRRQGLQVERLKVAEVLSEIDAQARKLVSLAMGQKHLAARMLRDDSFDPATLLGDFDPDLAQRVQAEEDLQRHQSEPVCDR